MDKIGEIGIMSKQRKNKEKLDVHVNFDMPLSQILRDESKKEQRSLAQLIRFVLTQHYLPSDSGL